MGLASICVQGELYDTAIKLGEDAVVAGGRFGGFSSGLENLHEILGTVTSARNATKKPSPLTSK